MLYRTEQLVHRVPGTADLELDGAVVAVQHVAGEIESAGCLADEEAESDALYGAVHSGVRADRFGVCTGVFHVKQSGASDRTAGPSLRACST
jgi:hypothetical protein